MDHSNGQWSNYIVNMNIKYRLQTSTMVYRLSTILKNRAEHLIHSDPEY